MSLGTLNALVDGLQQGTEFGWEGQDRHRKLAALKALGTTYAQGNPEDGGGQPQQQQPALPAMQPGGPLAALAMLGSRMTPQGGPPQGGPPQGGPPQGGPPQGHMPPAQPPQAPAAMPQRYPSPDLSAVAQAPTMGRPDYNPPSAIDEAHQNIKAIAGSIKAANPNIDPITLAMATEQQIESIKGVAPLTKATMTAQVQAARLGLDYQYKQARLNQMQQDLQVKMERARTDEERQQALDEYHQGMLQLGGDRIDAQRDIAAGHDDTSLKRGQMSSDASAYRADSSSGASAYRADSSSDASAYRADQGYRGGQARGGGAVDAAPAPPQRPQRGASLESGYAIKGPNGEPARLRGGKYEHFVSGKWVPYQ